MWKEHLTSARKLQSGDHSGKAQQRFCVKRGFRADKGHDFASESFALEKWPLPGLIKQMIALKDLI